MVVSPKAKSSRRLRAQQGRDRDPLANAPLIRRLREQGGEAGEQQLLTGTPGHLHPGDDTRPPSRELRVDRPSAPTSCACEPGMAASGAMQRELVLESVRAAQSGRWRRIQDALDSLQQHRQHRSAAKAWDSTDGWMTAFVEIACNFPWMEDPDSARLIAAPGDYGWCCAAIEAARQEMWLPAGMAVPTVPPVLRIEEVRPGDRFTELWISPRVPKREVLRLVRHAQVGVHLVAMAG